LDKLVDAPLYEGVRTMLMNLRARDKRLAIVTAGHRAAIETMLRAHDLNTFFEVVVSGTDVANKKPHPESLVVALQRLGVTDKARAVMIGDNSRDLLAAQRAGIDGVLFAHPESTEQIDELVAAYQPVAVVRSWPEFTL
jgi:HAD superfamily hydrolase (TIGR01509 family)